MSEKIKTVSQRRAAYALTEVQARIEGEKKLKTEDLAEFRSRANDLPALIHRNGLGQAVALYKAKGRGAHAALYAILAGWLCGQNQPYAGSDDLLAAITQGDAGTYRAAQAEAQALLIWVKQFVRAFVSDEQSEATDA